MKNILIATLIVGALCGAGYYEHNYTRKDCEVIQIDNGWATIQDKGGFTWDYKNGNLNVGDVVDLKMHDNNTISYIYDDIIKTVVVQ